MTTEPVQTIRQAIEDELSVLPPEEARDPFYAGCAAAYSFVLSLHDPALDAARHSTGSSATAEGVAELLADAMRAHDEQRRRGAYPHLGQDNDIRAFAEWVADWLDDRGYWLTDEHAEATNAAMNYGDGHRAALQAASESSDTRDVAEARTGSRFVTAPMKGGIRYDSRGEPLSESSDTWPGWHCACGEDVVHDDTLAGRAESSDTSESGDIDAERLAEALQATILTSIDKYRGPGMGAYRTPWDALTERQRRHVRQDAEALVAAYEETR